MSAHRLGWRVYLCTPEFWFYVYTVVEAKGEREAIEIVRGMITPGDFPLRAKLTSVSDEDCLPMLPAPGADLS